MFVSQKWLKATSPARSKLTEAYDQVRVPMKLESYYNAHGYIPYDQAAIHAAWDKWQQDCDAAKRQYQAEVAKFDHLRYDYTNEEHVYSENGHFTLAVPRNM